MPDKVKLAFAILSGLMMFGVSMGLASAIFGPSKNIKQILWRLYGSILAGAFMFIAILLAD